MGVDLKHTFLKILEPVHFFYKDPVANLYLYFIEKMNPVYIIDAKRTPVGKYGGILASIRPDDLLAENLKQLLTANPQIPTDFIDDLIIGCANQAGEDNRNIARFSALLAGFPDFIPGTTVNRLCGSGMQAIADGFMRISAGFGDLIVCGGVESMTRAPFVISKGINPFQRNIEFADTTFGWRFNNPEFTKKYLPLKMGETAEILSEKYKISREAQDAFALQSHRKYFKALFAGKLDKQLISIDTKDKAQNGHFLLDKDEAPREDTSLEKLAKLKPAFKEGGTVTAGNAAGINDGSCALILASEKMVKQLDLNPLAIISSFGVAGVHPDLMGTGPIPASQKALAKAGLKNNNLDLVEINEAFAVQVLICMEKLDLDPEVVNVNGGALAIGHPLGCSGARITTSLIHELAHRRKKFGMATMCIGVGQGISIIVENLIRN